MQDFRELKVWQKSHGLVSCVYRITRRFPPEELYGLTSQMRRAAVSIPANLAEGCGRKGRTEFAQFAHIAMGSASELKYYFLLAQELALIKSDEAHELILQIDEIQKMLAGFIQKMRSSATGKTP